MTSDNWCLGMNHALHKRTYQSTENEGNSQPGKSIATDGRKYPCFNTEDYSWWYVDMEKEVVVGKVVVYLRIRKRKQIQMHMEFSHGFL